MNQILLLTAKDLKLLLRDKLAFFFSFFFPLLYCIFFGMMFAGTNDESRPIEIVVVDEDQSEASAAFVKTLDRATEFEIQQSDRATASDLVRRGKRAAFVVITPGFGEARQRMFWGEPPLLELGVDPSRKAEAGMVRGVLTGCMFEGFQEVFSKPGAMQKRIDGWMSGLREADDVDPLARGALEMFLPALSGFLTTVPAGDGSGGGLSGWEPVAFKENAVAKNTGGPSSYQISFPQGIIWGVLGCAASFGISLVIERGRGTLVRLRMSPIARWQILGGKALACFATTMTLVTVLLTVGAIVFGVRAGSSGLLAAAVCSISIAFVGIMMLLSVLGKTEQSAAGIGWAIMIVMAMLGGGMIPLAFMPKWMDSISNFSPVKWSILAMEGAIWRDFSTVEMLKPCAILVGVGVVCFLVGTRAFRWTEQSH